MSDIANQRQKIAAIGRQVTPETVLQTREIFAARHSAVSRQGVNLIRDIRYGDHERQRLDVFTPEGDKTPRPVLIFVHGGGFIGGDKHTPNSPFYDNIGIWAVKNGFCGINITYRLAPEFKWPSGIEDLHRVLNWIKREGAAYGLDAGNTFLMGQSAGGAHAASYLAHPEIYGADQASLKGAILVSGLYNYESMQVGDLERAYLGDDKSLYGERSSLQGLLNTRTPLLVALAEYDPPFFEAQGLELLSALQAQNHKMPRFVHMIGHNHFSGVLNLGLEEDLLGDETAAFMNDLVAGKL